MYKLYNLIMRKTDKNFSNTLIDKEVCWSGITTIISHN